jgi:hypothetical protein
LSPFGVIVTVVAIVAAIAAVAVIVITFAVVLEAPTTVALAVAVILALLSCG